MVIEFSFHIFYIFNVFFHFILFFIFFNFFEKKVLHHVNLKLIFINVRLFLLYTDFFFIKKLFVCNQIYL